MLNTESIILQFNNIDTAEEFMTNNYYLLTESESMLHVQKLFKTESYNEILNISDICIDKFKPNLKWYIIKAIAYSCLDDELNANINVDIILKHGIIEDENNLKLLLDLYLSLARMHYLKGNDLEVINSIVNVFKIFPAAIININPPFLNSYIIFTRFMWDNLLEFERLFEIMEQSIFLLRAIAYYVMNNLNFSLFQIHATIVIYANYLLRTDRVKIFHELVSESFLESRLPMVRNSLIAERLLMNRDFIKALKVIDLIPNKYHTLWTHLYVIKACAIFELHLKQNNTILTRRKYNKNNEYMTYSMPKYCGRFGQQLSFYIWAKLTAIRKNLTLLTGNWIGEYVFELNDYLHTHEKSRYVSLIDDFGQNFFNIKYKNTVQKLLRPRDVWLPYIIPAVDRLKSMGNTIVTLHLRKEDQLQDVPSDNLYVDFLDNLWPQLDKPVLYLAGNSPLESKETFRKFKPYTLHDVAEPWGGLEFIQDFFVIAHSNVVTSQKSIFARLACMIYDNINLFLMWNQHKKNLEVQKIWTEHPL